MSLLQLVLTGPNREEFEANEAHVELCSLLATGEEYLEEANEDITPKVDFLLNEADMQSMLEGWWSSVNMFDTDGNSVCGVATH
jgi:hypothetical protein